METCSKLNGTDCEQLAQNRGDFLRRLFHVIGQPGQNQAIGPGSGCDHIQGYFIIAAADLFL